MTSLKDCHTRSIALLLKVNAIVSGVPYHFMFFWINTPGILNEKQHHRKHYHKHLMVAFSLFIPTNPPVHIM